MGGRVEEKRKQEREGETTLIESVTPTLMVHTRISLQESDNIRKPLHTTNFPNNYYNTVLLSNKATRKITGTILCLDSYLGNSQTILPITVLFLFSILYRRQLKFSIQNQDQ